MRFERVLKQTDFLIQRPSISPLHSTQSWIIRLSSVHYYETVSGISREDTSPSLLLFSSCIPSFQGPRPCHALFHALFHETLCAKA